MTFDESLSSERGQVSAFFDEGVRNRRMLSQAAFQLSDIASSKGWKFICYCRQVKAIFSNSEVHFFPKIRNFLTATAKIVGLNHSDIFRPGPTSSSPVSPEELQIRLFGEKIEKNSEIAVILHLFYVGLWSEIADLLSDIPEPFDLFISLPKEQKNFRSEIQKYFPNAHIYIAPNRGRDIAPFLEIFRAIFPLDYQFLCKLHSKRSTHLSTGENRRQSLFSELIGSEQRVNEILQLFRQNIEIDMVVPKGFLTGGIDIDTFTNRKNLETLAGLLNIPLHDYYFEYPAGSMFWCRPGCLEKLAGSGIRTADFPPERGQLNNTLAHAVERIFGLLVTDEGRQLIDTSVFQSYLNRKEKH